MYVSRVIGWPSTLSIKLAPRSNLECVPAVKGYRDSEKPSYLHRNGRKSAPLHLCILTDMDASFAALLGARDFNSGFIVQPQPFMTVLCASMRIHCQVRMRAALSNMPGAYVAPIAPAALDAATLIELTRIPLR